MYSYTGHGIPYLFFIVNVVGESGLEPLEESLQFPIPICFHPTIVDLLGNEYIRLLDYFEFLRAVG
jgi:hypothetical protein